MSKEEGKKAKQFVKNGASVVPDMIRSYVLSRPDIVQLADWSVVLRGDFEKVKEKEVTILCGGGSGHEPAHSSFVGHAMLTGAIAGGVFASPSTESVYAAIRAVCGPKGCLVIIKNYTGDRLNFGLACERAKEDGFDVRMVIVGDDAALLQQGSITGRRGLAGTILVQKIAGAVASRGGSLDEVAQAANSATKSLCTIGAALSVCTLPDSATDPRLGGDEYELGLGIHGEPGKQKLKMEKADEIASRMVTTLLESPYASDYKKGDKVVLMVNNLGGTPVAESYCMATYITEALSSKYQMSAERLLVGHFMTSLDMEGISLTLMRLDDSEKASILENLDTVTTAPAWPHNGCQVRTTPHSFPFSLPSRSCDGKGSGVGDEELFKAALNSLCAALLKEKDQLNLVDKHVGDGDTGDTFSRGAKEIQEKLESKKISFHSSDRFLSSIADIIGSAMGGSSGAVLEIFLRATGTHLSKIENPTIQDWVTGLQKGTDAIQFYGGASRGMRTILDAMIPAFEAAQNLLSSSPSSSLSDVLRVAEEAAMKGVEETKEMEGKAGRSSYIPMENLKSWPDSGALAFAIIVRAVAQVVK